MSSQPKIESTVLGFDVGEKRIGVARVHPLVKIAEPLEPIDARIGPERIYEKIENLAQEYNAAALVVGLPRGLDGQETSQTAYCRSFAEALKSHTDCQVYLIDEAGSSKEADIRIGIRSSNISRDSMAAAVFLEDFIEAKNQHELQI